MEVIRLGDKRGLQDIRHYRRSFCVLQDNTTVVPVFSEKQATVVPVCSKKQATVVPVCAEKQATVYPVCSLRNKALLEFLEK